jgi:hypothetical protein
MVRMMEAASDEREGGKKLRRDLKTLEERRLIFRFYYI